MYNNEASLSSAVLNRGAHTSPLRQRLCVGDTTPTSTHQVAGGSPFTISGVPLTQDVAVFEAGLDTAVNDQLSLGISYTGQVGDGVSDHGLRGNLSWKC